MSDTQAARDRLRGNLKSFGLSDAAVAIYTTLLEFGPQTKQTLLSGRVVSVEDIDTGLSLLQAILLIAEHRDRRNLRYYATNPNVSWKWQEYSFVWERVRSLVDVDSEELSDDEKAQTRLRLLRSLRADAAILFDLRRHNVVDDRRGRIMTSEGEYALACAEVITMAKEEIVALDRPPHATQTLPIFWSAITDRRASGVAYRRYVPLEEMLLHGLDVVERDINEVGVDLHITDPINIKRTFYLVDNRYLLMRFVTPSEQGGLGRLTHDKHKIQRFRTFAEGTAARARPASAVLPHARAWVEALLGHVTDRFDHRHHAEIIDQVARLGKFADIPADSEAAVGDLLTAGLIENVDTGRYVLTPPADRDFASAASLR